VVEHVHEEVRSVGRVEREHLAPRRRERRLADRGPAAALAELRDDEGVGGPRRVRRHQPLRRHHPEPQHALVRALQPPAHPEPAGGAVSGRAPGPRIGAIPRTRGAGRGHLMRPVTSSWSSCPSLGSRSYQPSRVSSSGSVSTCSATLPRRRAPRASAPLRPPAGACSAASGRRGGAGMAVKRRGMSRARSGGRGVSD
jgi:hypothetical protein